MMASLSQSMNGPNGNGDRGQTTQPVIVTKGLWKSYGQVRALVDATFQVDQGETVAIVGDNGAGKSTLVKILTGAVQPDTGSIALDGREVAFRTTRDSLQLGVTAVYQNLALADNMTVAENVFLGRVPTKWLRVDRRRMERESAELLGSLAINVPDVRALTASLSGGQRQAVAIARSFRSGRRLMILDEPTAALGVQEGQKVLGIIEGLKGQRVSIIVVSHNLDHVFRVADRIVVMRGGRIVGSRPKKETTTADIVHLIVGTRG